jgi:putative Mn2+ efflux pump MntP
VIALVAVPPLLAAAALVGVLHMSAPDHWVTLCILAQASQWRRSRLLAVSLVTAFGHVVLSVALGFAVVLVGTMFTQTLSEYLTTAIGAVMLLAGGFYGVWTLRSNHEEDYQKEAEQEGARIGGRGGRGVGYFAVLGGALSPDLSILPVFLLAVPMGVGVAIDTAIVFAVGSILSLTLLVLVGSKGLSEVFARVPPEYNDALVGFVIAAVGIYVLYAG